MQKFGMLSIRVGDYTRKCGFSKVVIGLRGFVVGGCDRNSSTGAENVLGVLMPSHSSDHSIQDALQLAENLGIQTHTCR